jgi:hypothetical protein
MIVLPVLTSLWKNLEIPKLTRSKLVCKSDYVAGLPGSYLSVLFLAVFDILSYYFCHIIYTIYLKISELLSAELD